MEPTAFHKVPRPLPTAVMAGAATFLADPVA